jgi:hypothetical protein
MQASEARENAETGLGFVNPVRVAKKTAVHGGFFVATRRDEDP